MRRLAVLFERRLVTIDLVEVIDVLVFLVLQYVEAVAARLVLLGAERIDLDRLQKLIPPVQLDPNLDPQCNHKHLLFRAKRYSPSTSFIPYRPGGLPASHSAARTAPFE